MTFRLWDRIRDWVILGVLLTVSLITMLTANQSLLAGLRATALESTAWLEARFAWVGGYFQALAENEVLREENIELSSRVARSREAMLENERLRRLVGFSDTTGYDLLAARIINKDFTQQWNYLTLDVGALDSVGVDMAVIDERGILGKVVLVSTHYAKVMPYANTDFRIPAKVQPLQAFGIVRWEGTRMDRLRLDHIVKTEPVEAGQLVVTAGYSGVFPPGLAVGTVDSVSARTGRNELTIFLRPAAPMSTAEHVFVVMQQPDPERLALERESFR
ncbi:MAG: rod shape-determining protein MreC [Rhodothermales bacterium]